ncbi:MAG: glutamyl-tRNA reductase [Candidatus Omnitrophica bacterium]|nr:glutamyl-tRNA reductase [Candidatus Omnitrophota bacterium]
MSQKQFVVIGLNHKTAPVELRERFAVTPSRLPVLLSAFGDYTGLASCVCLSTCNRTEFYMLLSSLDGELERVKSFLAEYHKIERGQFENALYVHPGERGVEHLFKVASGLDSLVLGESEILGQVKQAYLTAQAQRKLEKALHLLFQRSLRVAKKVRTETGIGRGLCSVGSVAVLMAEKIFGDLSQRTIMVIGAGKMGELTARHLLKAGASSILVSNRSFLRAEELAKRLKGVAIHFDHLFERMEKVDIVISSTAAPHFVVTKEELLPLMKKRRGRPLFLIDIGVPRNIEPAVDRIENVFLYNIDDLEKVTRSSTLERALEMEKGLALIRRETLKAAALLQAASSHG